MNCPKCGFSQEERPDCRKCGVIFSKYYAIRATNKSVATEVMEAPQLQFDVAENTSADIADLRQNLRELNRRLNEVEFERAERTQLRGEFRSLDKKISETLAQVTERLNAVEKHAADTPVPPPAASPKADIADLRQSIKELNRRLKEVESERAQRTHLRGELRSLDKKISETLAQVLERLSGVEKHAADTPVPPPAASPEDIQQLKNHLIDEHLSPMRTRLDQVDGTLEALQKKAAPHADSWTIEMLGQLEHQMAQLEDEIAALAETSRAQIEGLPADVAKLSKDMEELRVSLQNVSMRYSEIGDLKKNHLVLLNRVESFESQLEQAKKAPELAATNRVPGLEAEISALRAETRQCLKRLEQLETASPAASRDFGLVMKELEGSKRMHAEQSERMQEALESRLKKELGPLSEIPNQLAGIALRQQSLEESYEEIHTRTRETLQRVTDLDKTTLSLRTDLEKMRSELLWSEEKLTAILAQPPEEPRPPLEEDVHVIRETLDELRRFLSSKKP